MKRKTKKDSIPKHPLPDGGPMIACQLHGRARRDKFLSHATLFAPSKPSGLSLLGLRYVGLASNLLLPAVFRTYEVLRTSTNSIMPCTE